MIGDTRDTSVGPDYFMKLAMAGAPFWLICGITSLTVASYFDDSLVNLRLIGVFSLLMAVWSGIWFHWVIPYRLDIDDQMLRWRSTFRSGKVPISSIESIRASKFAPWRGRGAKLTIIRSSTGVLMVMETKRTAALVRRIRALKQAARTVGTCDGADHH